MKIIAISEKGDCRKVNQDSYLIGQEAFQNVSCKKEGEQVSLFGVFDGVGGASHGEIASFAAALKASNSHVEPNEDSLREFVTMLNEEVVEECKKRCEDMATTCVLLLIEGEDFYCANVGDSSLFRVRDGIMHKYSTDDTPQTAGARSHMLLNYLGKRDFDSKEINVNIQRFGINEGDLFLLCSDGVTDMSKDGQLEDILCSEMPIEDIASSLKKMVYENGSRDNLTMVLVQI